MATQSQKIALIDKINELFINIQTKELSKDYEKFFNNVNRKLNSLAKNDGLTLAQVKSIINDVPLNLVSIKKTILLSFLLSGLTNIIEKQQLDVEDRESLLPVIALVGLYGLVPKKIVSKLNTLSNAVVSNNSSKLTSKDKQAFKLIKQYTQVNDNVISKNIKEFEDGLRRINKDIRSSTSKSIFKKYRQLRRTDLAPSKLGDELKKTFSNQTARIERIARTEIKRQTELIKLSHHLSLGYTHKRWNTQGDGKVSLSHQAMSGIVIEIDKKFHIPGIDRKPSAWVMYPGDPSAPVGQIANERCFVTFIKRKKK